MRSFWNRLRHRARRADYRRSHRTILRVTGLEERTTPAVAFTATGAIVGTAPLVTVFRADGTTLAQFIAYDLGFRGGVSVAVGEIDGNSNTVEVVTGAGPGGGPHVRVFGVNTTTRIVQPLASFMAYDINFAGGVNVAVGKFSLSRVGQQVVTGAGPGGGPHVRVFDIGFDGTATQAAGPLGSFFAFDPAFGGGVRVVAGELDGTFLDGDELVATAGPGGGPHVRIFTANGAEFASFFAFDTSYIGGTAPGVVDFTQLTINSLVGGGVSLFTFGPGGRITSRVLVPIR